MIKMIEIIRQIIDEGADLMRSQLLKCLLNHAVESGQCQHQCFLTLTCRYQNMSLFYRIATRAILVQDRLDADDCVKNIRTCIALERCKFIQVKDVVLGSLIGKISIFDCGKAYQLCRLACLCLIDLMVLRNLTEHLFIDICDQMFQTHHTALTGLKRLAVLAVHCTEAKELQTGILFDQSGLSRTAEHLNEVHLLTFVHHIDDLIRIKQFPALNDRRQICRRIKSSAVRLQDDTRRHFLCIALLRHIDNQRTLIHVGIALFLHFFYHFRNVRLCIALLFPEIKFYVQIAIVLFQICNGNVQNLLPQRTVAAHTTLQLCSRLQRCLTKCFVHLGLSARRRVNLLQLGDRKRCFFRVFSLIGLIKIDELRLALLYLCDNKPHLQTPVAQMYITDHLMSDETADSLDALTDNRRT